MNYKVMELTLGEKIAFYLVVLIGGLLIGWIFYDSCAGGILIGAVLLSLEGEYKAHLLNRRNQELLLQFRDFLYSLSSSVGAGRSIRQGIIESYDFWKATYKENDYIMLEMQDFMEKMEKSNVEDVALLEDFGERSGQEDIEDMAMMCRVCKKTGANLPRTLMECSNIIGDKIMLERELHTIMAQKKFEGYIIALAPVIMMLLMKIISSSYLEPLTSTNAGRFISTISLALITAAWLSIERVNRIEV